MHVGAGRNTNPLLGLSGLGVWLGQHANLQFDLPEQKESSCTTPDQLGNVTQAARSQVERYKDIWGLGALG